MYGIVCGVHRHVYQECFGEIPEGMVVRHKCNNTICVNPEHLELGTHIDNMRDRAISGRTASGEKAGHAKLTVTQVNEIRRSNEITSVLAHRYSVSRVTIISARYCRTYKNVPEGNRLVFQQE